MKKFLAIFLAILLLIPTALANGTDYSSMSVTELQQVINEARNELLKKTAQSEGKLFILDENNGLQIYLTGKTEKNWSGAWQLELVVINNTSDNLSVNFDHIVINGWETYGIMTMVTDINAGNKKKDYILLHLEDTDISSISEVEEIKFVFHTFDSSTYRGIKQYGPITIYYDGSNWSK